jgi:5-methylcytosine-specific restriction endonuclease McrA
VVGRDDGRCRGCGVREALVVGDVLHLHAVVAPDAGGHRHVHNVVALCPICHERVHERG